MDRISYIGVLTGVLTIVALLFVSHVYYSRPSQSSGVTHVGTAGG
jgi:hypothetical protein